MVSLAISLLACESQDVQALTPEERMLLDEDCFDGCVAKGVDRADCLAICADPEKQKQPVDKPSPDASVDTGRDAGDVPDAGDDKIVVEREKSCVECLETTVTCASEAAACARSLACQQLQWCPSICGKPGCIAECDRVIPTGVPLLSALVQCAACGSGPCTTACADTEIRAHYCP